MIRRLLVVLVLAGQFVPAHAAPTVYSFRCHGAGGAQGAARTIEAMENSYIAGTGYGPCWFHTGHHTYDMGAPHHVYEVSGSLFTVESLFSPPTDLDPLQRTTALLAFEGSVDGVNWATLAQIPFNFRVSRQDVEFAFDAGGAVARYLRIAQPRAATQGLSGFLDSSGFEANVAPAGTSSARGPGTYTCADDVMERFFSTHPCWFGGINRYDSPSVFHTYPVGRTAVDTVAGHATFAPWRSDDYYYDGGDPLELDALVQHSADGVTWTTAARVTGEYGQPIPFSVSIGGTEASFVRIVAEYMKNPVRHPALKHVRGMLVDSAITVTGQTL